MPIDDFASKLLKRYGWTEGTGLGKHRTGITRAIQQSAKENARGVGYESNQFDPWWDKVYNAAAINVQVEGSTSSDDESHHKEKRRKRKKKRSSK